MFKAMPYLFVAQDSAGGDFCVRAGEHSFTFCNFHKKSLDYVAHDVLSRPLRLARYGSDLLFLFGGKQDRHVRRLEGFVEAVNHVRDLTFNTR